MVQKRRFGTVTLAALFAGALGAPSAAASPTVSTKNHVKKVQVHLLDEAGAEAVGAPKVKGGVTEVEVIGTSTPMYTARLDAGRVIVDVSDADVDASVSAITGKTGVVGGVMTQVSTTGDIKWTRVSIALAKDATYRVRVDGTTLRIWLSPSEAKVDAPSASVAGTTASKGVKVTDVTFAHELGVDKVMVKLTGPVTYSSNATATGKSKIELTGATLPDDLERTLDVSAFKGNVSAISTFRKQDNSGAIVFEADRLADVTADAKIESKTDGTTVLVWTFSRVGSDAFKQGNDSTKTGIGYDGGIAKKTKTIGKEPALVETKSEDDSASSFLSSVPMQAAGKYTGRRIDLDFKDADVHNILRLLADVGKVNIVTTDDVKGEVTIRMRNVPWDQALDVVLQSKGLGMVRQGNLIRVAPLAQLQKERELRLAQQRAEFELTPTETRLIPVNYATASELQARAKDLLSPRGSLAVDERTNTLIARDVTGVLNHIEELVRSLDTQTAQVLVEARIVEATSRYLRDVGIQWGGDATFSEATGNPTGIAFPSKVTAAGGGYDGNTPTAGLSPFTRNVPTPNFAVNLPAAVGTGQGGALGLTFGSIDNNFNIGVRLSAAEVSGLVRIVSSPRILTLDNREARINQGTLIPFSQVSAQGVQTTFQEAKLQLLVRPHVTADGAVAMHVKVNRDEPDFTQTSARGDPTILKREAETDLLVMDGHTAVIGGIFTRNTGRNLDQVPFFGDIPILGILFQRRRASDARNELVIFLTPRIVNRAEALGR